CLRVSRYASVSCSSSPLFDAYAAPPYLHSFPTRRSSDLSCPISCAAMFENDRRGSRPVKVGMLIRSSFEQEWILSKRAARLRQRSEEHTSELQSRFDLVCRLLLEKKNKVI